MGIGRRRGIIWELEIRLRKRDCGRPLRTRGRATFGWGERRWLCVIH